MTDDQIDLRLITAILSDDAKAQRLKEIAEATDALRKERAALAAERAEVDERHRVATGSLEETRQIKADIDNRSAELDKREKDIGEVIQAVNAEKVKFEEVRNRVTSDMQSRNEALGERERAVGRREEAVAAAEKDLADRHAAMLESETALTAKHDALHAALSAAFQVSPDRHNGEGAEAS